MSTDLLITGVSILTLTGPAGPAATDVSVTGGRVTAVGGPREPARRTIDGAGAVLVPLADRTVEEGRPAAERFRDKEIAAGNAATFVLVDRPVSRGEALDQLVVRPAGLRAVVLAGEVVVGPGGEPVTGIGPLAPADPRLGTWIDRSGYLHQALDAQGRYDETRAGRRHAWQGRYWVGGDRIVYLDDTGFWAFGEFVRGELHHAGYVMRQG
ncbi:Atu4866 domain-containing protein [Kineosporia sp. J2-2]|uniref:Atu4866 domain-containing protein n=1 Tax=Kineosporia corallincola TaxID=2835133 RepID=A0ABS5TEM0_9ACTN|nr:Atu4866 domain-containing protein [Kineosporia corallincola]MBT0769533.1 Atu4866 domain-containing protein [Kineosporia corallincola]